MRDPLHSSLTTRSADAYHPLVGGTPAQVPSTYHDRSPVFFAEKITADLLILQGLDDKVVPPGQAETMVKKINEAGGKVEAVYYEGEGHGFRQAKNIKDSIEKTREALERMVAKGKKAGST